MYVIQFYIDTCTIYMYIYMCMVTVCSVVVSVLWCGFRCLCFFCPYMYMYILYAHTYMKETPQMCGH